MLGQSGRKKPTVLRLLQFMFQRNKSRQTNIKTEGRSRKEKNANGFVTDNNIYSETLVISLFRIFFNL